MLVELGDEILSEMTASEVHFRLFDAKRDAEREMVRGAPHLALPFYCKAITLLAHLPWIEHIPKAAFALLSDKDTSIPGDAAACAVATGQFEKAIELLDVLSGTNHSSLEPPQVSASGMLFLKIRS